MIHSLVGESKARLAKWQHGNPARGLKIIAVAGSHGKTTTALLLNELLQEAGAHTAVLSGGHYDTSTESFFKSLSKARKTKAYYVIVEVTERLLKTNVLRATPLELLVITNDSATAQELLSYPANYCVMPTELKNNEHLKVSPHQVIRFGAGDEAEAQLAVVTERRKGTELELIIDHQTRITAATHLVGYANALNLAAALSAAYVLAAPTSSFEEGAARLEKVTANYDYIETEATDDKPYDIVVDAAKTKTSIELVMTSAKKLAKRRLITVLDSTVSVDSFSELVQKTNRLLVVGDVPEAPGVEILPDINTAVQKAMRSAKAGDLLLLLGSQFAEMINENTTKAHELVGSGKDNESSTKNS